MAEIRIEGLSHVYGAGTPFEKKAVDDVSLTIPAGTFLGVIGHTGSGKSTLIQHLNGLLKPTSGRVLLDGRDIWAGKGSRRELRFRVGLVFQYPEHQLFEETIRKDIAFGPKNMGLSPEEIDRRVDEAMAFVGLPDGIGEKSPFEVSGGQKRRVAIAGVMAMEPEVLILDEPTAGLDPQGSQEILSRIREYRRLRGNTVILVSHSMEDIAACADRILVMSGAKCLMLGTPDEVFARSDEIAAAGLSVPSVTEVFLQLRRLGFDVSPAVYTIPQAIAELRRYRGVMSC